MRAWLSLQRELFLEQSRQIARALEDPTPALKAYQRAYRRRTRTFDKVIGRPEVEAQLRAADVVYVGDYHTLRRAQLEYVALARAALSTGRRVVLAVELIEARHQKALEEYLAGRSSEQALLARVGCEGVGQSSLWAGFRAVLQLARAADLEVVAIDRRARGPRSLAVRDAFAAQRIASAARGPGDPVVLVLMGQFHLAPEHLPGEVKRALGERRRRHLVVFQNCESPFWALLRAGRLAEAEAVQMGTEQLCLFNSSPLICQQSFLDYLGAAGGESAAIPRLQRVDAVCRALGRFLALPAETLAMVASERRATPSAAASDDSEDEDEAERLAARAERALQSLRRAHLGTEGTRRSRGASPACETALKFFASKLIHPHRVAATGSADAGRSLGEAMFRAFARGAMSEQEARALLLAPCPEPAELRSRFEQRLTTAAVVAPRPALQSNRSSARAS